MTETHADGEALRRIVHALLIEWTLDVQVQRGRHSVDFIASSLAPLGVITLQRFRLFQQPASTDDLNALSALADSRGETPVAILSQGATGTVPTIARLGAAEIESLAEQSSVLVRTREGVWDVDGIALGDLADQEDTRLALVNGLGWLRPLARNRVPPSLRRTGRPAHELFERCFFTVMTSTFAARGTSWGTNKRGQVRPDGLLELPTATRLTIYDCKATYVGYSPTYRDILGFADYVVQPVGWTPPAGPGARFLVVSSSFQMSGSGSFSKRAQQLRQKAPGVDLVCIRARDLVRFGAHLERTNLSMEGRLAVNWERLLSAGSVQWSDFETELNALRLAGYEVDG